MKDSRGKLVPAAIRERWALGWQLHIVSRYHTNYKPFARGKLHGQTPERIVKKSFSAGKSLGSANYLLNQKRQTAFNISCYEVNQFLALLIRQI